MDIAFSVQQIQPSYIREILAAASDDKVISLAGGLPDEQTFPLALIQSTINTLTTTPSAFQYGQTQGYTPLIQYLNAAYHLPKTHGIMITTGSQQGLDLIARSYINPGDRVAMEAPCYLGAMQVFGLSRATIVTVSQEEDGPNINQLQSCFKKHSPKMFYAVPDFHNPTGVCWSLAKRQQVAELCIKYHVTLIEDAPYRELRFHGESLPLVSDFCPDQAIVLRSFSKIASPGLRIGCVSGKQEFLAPLIKVKQGADLHSSVPAQVILLGLLQHAEFQQHLYQVRSLYKARCDTLCQTLEASLPSECRVVAPQGGMFIWITLPPCDTFALAKTLLEHHVAIVPSPVFYPADIEAPSAIRLNFTHASHSDLILAAQRIVNVLSQANHVFHRTP